jgi:signal transduction histidine kinase/FixJ family two-component response regulator
MSGNDWGNEGGSLARLSPERQRRYTAALDRLATAAIASKDLDAFLSTLLAMFVEVAGVGVAVARVREGNRLRSRAAIGLEEEVKAGFSLPIDQGVSGRCVAERAPVTIRAAELDTISGCEFLHKRGVRAIYCVPLLDDDELMGVVYAGALEDRDFSDEVKHLLNATAARASCSVARQLDREALERAIRTRDEVLAAVAHDLRNPISVITIAVNTLSHRVRDPLARRPIESILKGVHRTERLIRDLLDLGAIETGRFSIEKRPVEVADIILAAVDSQQTLAAEASIILAPDLSPDLPSVDGDAERLLQVLENLIGNAFKFTPPNGSVVVGATHQDNRVTFWVNDTGAGLSADQIPHLFDRYYQANGRDRRGAGLGLTICKAIAEAHGGRIWATSTLGAGTTISFTVPVSSDLPSTVPTEIAHILLVDDKPENLLSLSSILENPRYNLVTAASGEEALSLSLRLQFSLALIDIAMPQMNGLEVAVHLKELERSRDIPIIFITAFGDDPEEIHRAYSAGGADYLVKPLDPEVVRKKVAVFVDLSRRRRDAGRSKSRNELSNPRKSK